MAGRGDNRTGRRARPEPPRLNVQRRGAGMIPLAIPAFDEEILLPRTLSAPGPHRAMTDG